MFLATAFCIPFIALGPLGNSEMLRSTDGCWLVGKKINGGVEVEKSCFSYKNIYDDERQGEKYYYYYYITWSQ